MLFGELVPKNLAIAMPLQTAKATARAQRLFTASIKGPLAFLNGSANFLVRRLGIEPQEALRSARSSTDPAQPLPLRSATRPVGKGGCRTVEVRGLPSL